MKKYLLVFAIAAAVALPAGPILSQQKEGTPAKEGHGMMGGGMMQGGAMMCPMMGMGGMGMMGGMGGDPAKYGADDADEG